MNILFFGDGVWAQIALKELLNQSEINVLGVILRYDKQDKVLRTISEENNIPVIVDKNVNSDEFVEYCKNLHLDLGVSMSFNQIIKINLRKTAKHGFINCHAGKLPNYRGRNILNWALINDEKEIGITTHFIDDGIDTGDIILQEIVPIEESDDYKTLLDKAICKCPEVLIKAILKIKNNDVKIIKQSHINGSYFSYRRLGDEFIDWNWSSRRIHNFVRALVEPSPGAQTYLENKKIYIWKSEETDFPNYFSTPGEVIGKNKDGIVVKTGDNALKITLISYDLYGEKIVPQICVGDRLGINLYKQISDLEERIKILETKNNR